MPETADGLVVERFPALLTRPGIVHGFVGRIAGIDVAVDRAEALARLDAAHAEARRQLDLAKRRFMTAEQVHGQRVAVLAAGAEEDSSRLAGADGIVTNRPDVCLGIYVADCCAVYLADARRRVVGLVHSGKKGTELGIVAHAVKVMHEHFGCEPQDLLAQLSPCIRPPWYEVDFAREIVAQCHAVGVGTVEDAGTCTAANPDLYYSYRREKGRTGRMLALLALGCHSLEMA